MLDPASTVVLVNPVAAGGRVGREWSEWKPRLEASLGPVSFRLTERAGHARDLATAAVQDGKTTIIAVGGDGTMNEVVNGIMNASPEPGVVTLGELPAGTGGDFRRLLAHGDDVFTAAAAMAEAPATPIDVGHVSWRADDGSTQSGWFLNITSFGIGGLVDRFVNASSKRLGGKLSFLLATGRASVTYKPARLKLVLDGETWGTWTVTNVQVCNGRFAGGGMHFAPDARLSDGLFDVVVIEDMPLLTQARGMKKLYDGSHVQEPYVHVKRARHVVAEPVTDHPAWIDIDGEAPGTAPAELTVHPGAIRLLDARPEVL